jgi:hypothetical protein
VELASAADDASNIISARIGEELSSRYRGTLNNVFSTWGVVQRRQTFKKLADIVSYKKVDAILQIIPLVRLWGLSRGHCKRYC